jgi:predicted RNase H-like HicB family nuclease
MSSSKPKMQVEINLDFALEKDERTGNYIAYIEQFPQAIGAGANEKEAMEHLLQAFRIMVEERGYDIKQQIVDKYMGDLDLELDNLKISA